MVTEVRPVQLSNAYWPIEVTEPGMVTAVRPVQFWNAELPIEVTELGMVIEVRPAQFWNALFGIVVTFSPKVTLLTSLIKDASNVQFLPI